MARRVRAPTHPGAILREDVLPAMGVTVSQAARDLKISRQMLHGILAEERSLTPEMAVRLGKYTGNGPGLWLRMQQAHDIWRAEQELEDVLKEIPTRDVA